MRLFLGLGFGAFSLLSFRLSLFRFWLGLFSLGLCRLGFFSRRSLLGLLGNLLLHLGLGYLSFFHLGSILLDGFFRLGVFLVLFATLGFTLSRSRHRSLGRRTVPVTLTTRLAALVIGCRLVAGLLGLLVVSLVAGFLLVFLVLRIPLRTVTVLAAVLGIPAVIATVVVSAVIRAFVVGRLVLLTLATAATTGLVVAAVVAVTAAVVVAAVLGTALAAIVAVAVTAATATALIITGYAGFPAILAGLGPTVVSPLAGGAALVGGAFAFRLVAAEEAGNLLAQFAEQAFFLLAGFLAGWRRCRSGRRSRRANGFYSGLFAYRLFGAGHFNDGFFFALVVLLGNLVAGNVFRGGFILAQADDFEVRGFHVGHRGNHNRDSLAGFDIGQLLALLVQQEGGHRDRHHGADFGGFFLGRLFVDQAHDAQGQGFDTPDGALAFTARAHFTAGFTQRRAQALP